VRYCVRCDCYPAHFHTRIRWGVRSTAHRSQLVRPSTLARTLVRSASGVVTRLSSRPRFLDTRNCSTEGGLPAKARRRRRGTPFPYPRMTGTESRTLASARPKTPAGTWLAGRERSINPVQEFHRGAGNEFFHHVVAPVYSALLVAHPKEVPRWIVRVIPLTLRLSRDAHHDVTAGRCHPVGANLLRPDRANNAKNATAGSEKTHRHTRALSGSRFWSRIA
jgi:hypothetical protein